MTEPNQRILVVDDNLVHLEMSRQFLDSFNGISVDFAVHPDQGKELISKNDPFSIIWSEYQFNNSAIDGIEFLRDASLASPLSSKLLCSGVFSKSEILTRVKDKKADTYLTKPINIKSTYNALEIGITN